MHELVYFMQILIFICYLEYLLSQFISNDIYPLELLVTD